MLLDSLSTLPIDAIFWTTGAVVWGVFALVVVVYILPAAPALLLLAASAPFEKCASWLDSVYYDGPEDVQEARDSGAWYYYVIHYLFVVSRAGMSLFERWLGFLDPYYDRLPKG